jgi:uncharacterized damage-inducible protein DinB
MTSLAAIFDGWDGFQTSLVHAIAPLTPAQLRWHPAGDLRTVGQLARHISLGRLTWFLRMDAPGSADLAAQITSWQTDSDGNRHIAEDAIAITEDPAELVRWLESTWGMIAATLDQWQVADLSRTYRHTWNGTAYANSVQWTIWRILTHDVYHGGELSLMLGMQGIESFELTAFYGHITLPPLADAPRADETRHS